MDLASAIPSRDRLDGIAEASNVDRTRQTRCFGWGSTSFRWGMEQCGQDEGVTDGSHREGVRYACWSGDFVGLVYNTALIPLRC